MRFGRQPPRCRAALPDDLHAARQWPWSFAIPLLAAWRERRRHRAELRRLLTTGRHLIEDLGLDTETAEREIEKPFWEA